jgi:hypothetical protein
MGAGVSTCIDNGVTRSGGVWERKVTVPVGTMIRVQIGGGDTRLSSCSILDETRTIPLTSASGPSCLAEAR